MARVVGVAARRGLVTTVSDALRFLRWSPSLEVTADEGADVGGGGAGADVANGGGVLGRKKHGLGFHLEVVHAVLLVQQIRFVAEECRGGDMAESTTMA